MIVSELMEYLKEVNEDAEVCVVDREQNCCYEIFECSFCEDKTSEDYKKYIDIVADIKE